MSNSSFPRATQPHHSLCFYISPIAKCFVCFSATVFRAPLKPLWRCDASIPHTYNIHTTQAVKVSTDRTILTDKFQALQTILNAESIYTVCRTRQAVLGRLKPSESFLSKWPMTKRPWCTSSRPWHEDTSTFTKRPCSEQELQRKHFARARPLAHANSPNTQDYRAPGQDQSPHSAAIQPSTFSGSEGSPWQTQLH